MQKRQVKSIDNQSENRVVRLVRLLLASFVVGIQLIVPLAPVFADELDLNDSVTAAVTENTSNQEESEQADISEEEVHEEESEDSSTEEASSVIVEPEQTEEQIGDDAESTSEDIQQIDPTESSEEETKEILEDEAEPDETNDEDNSVEGGETTNEDTGEVTATSTSEETDSDTTATSTETETEDASEEVNEELSEETEVLPDSEQPIDEGSTTTPTTTPTTVVVQPEEHTVLSDDGRYNFGSDECARVADGSFYCTKDTENQVVLEDRVYAGPDVDGDNEIFIDKDGVSHQVTHNLADDVAPFYDAVSETIVWHRLVDARYQIISLDLETLLETQLTFDSYNNMQPTRFDDLTVWQGWVGNDWEIVMRADDEIVMLTDNTTHDVGPRINGEYIIWQSEESDGWKVRIYNTNTRQIETIDDTDGASIENPRLLLVYEAKHENGDIETRGYDLESGKNVALSSEAPVLPDELPNPDQTGEDRALITAVTQVKPKTDEEEDGEPDIVPVDPVIDTGTSTVTGEEDIVIPPFNEEAQAESDILPPLVQTETPIDLVIPPLAEVVYEPPVEDLVIPPFDDGFVEQDDSQTEVAKTE